MGVFGYDVRFHSNGTLVPRDLVESHWTKKSILKPSLAATWYTDLTKHIQPTNTFSLRTYLRYLRESMDRDNQQGENFKKNLKNFFKNFQKIQYPQKMIFNFNFKMIFNPC